MAILLPKNNYCGNLFVYNKARIVLTTKLYLKQLRPGFAIANTRNILNNAY